MLTKESFNALLKTLEEPPKYAYFILATTEFNKIPETITSRCQCFPFRHISEHNIVRRLQFIADQEHITVDREALHAIAHVSEGGMRDAISLLDQLRSLESITAADVKTRLGTTGHEYIEDVFAALSAKDRDALIKSIAKVEEAGVPLDVFTRQLLKVTREALHKAIKQHEKTDGLLAMMNTLLSAITNIRSNPIPGLALEGALLSLCDEGETMPVIAAKKETQKEGVENAEETEVTEVAERIASDISLEAVQKSWQKVISETSPASVKMSLKNGRVAAVNDKTIRIVFSSAFHKDKVAETDASRAIEQVLASLFHTPLTLECTLEGSASVRTEKQETPIEDIVNLADAAAEIF